MKWFGAKSPDDSSGEGRAEEDSPPTGEGEKNGVGGEPKKKRASLAKSFGIGRKIASGLEVRGKDRKGFVAGFFFATLCLAVVALPLLLYNIFESVSAVQEEIGGENEAALSAGQGKNFESAPEAEKKKRSVTEAYPPFFPKGQHTIRRWDLEALRRAGRGERPLFANVCARVARARRWPPCPSGSCGSSPTGVVGALVPTGPGPGGSPEAEGGRHERGALPVLFRGGSEINLPGKSPRMMTLLLAEPEASGKGVAGAETGSGGRQAGAPLFEVVGVAGSDTLGSCEPSP